MRILTLVFSPMKEWWAGVRLSESQTAGGKYDTGGGKLSLRCASRVTSPHQDHSECIVFLSRKLWN